MLVRSPSYCLRSKTWGSLRLHVHLCNNASAHAQWPGFMQQRLPKGTDLAVFSQVELDDIAWKMNTRPRKNLGWKCPAELFMPESFDFRQHHHEIDLENRQALREILAHRRATGI
ncbi:MAG: hypothetical protein VB125_03035 [Burkholderia sp.]